MSIHIEGGLDPHIDDIPEFNFINTSSPDLEVEGGELSSIGTIGIDDLSELVYVAYSKYYFSNISTLDIEFDIDDDGMQDTLLEVEVFFDTEDNDGDEPSSLLSTNDVESISLLFKDGNSRIYNDFKDLPHFEQNELIGELDWEEREDGSWIVDSFDFKTGSDEMDIEEVLRIIVPQGDKLTPSYEDYSPNISIEQEENKPGEGMNDLIDEANRYKDSAKDSFYSIPLLYRWGGGGLLSVATLAAVITLWKNRN